MERFRDLDFATTFLSIHHEFWGETWCVWQHEAWASSLRQYLAHFSTLAGAPGQSGPIPATGGRGDIGLWVITAGGGMGGGV